MELAVGEPPRWVSIEAIRRRAIRRRVTQVGVASLAAVLAAGLGATLSAGAANRAGPVTTTRNHAGPPRYYVIQAYGRASAQDATEVRATATGRVTAVIPSPRRGVSCGGQLAAASNGAFFIECSIWRSAPPKNSGRIAFVETLIYTFRLTASGHVIDYSLVKGSVLKGLWGDNLAVAPDGSELAVEVLRPGPSHEIFTNSVTAGIFVINTRTGARTLWHSRYVPGAFQFADAIGMSFTRDGSDLVVYESRCPRSRYRVNCQGKGHTQIRAYAPAAGGGSLDRGRVLLQPDRLKPAGYNMLDAVVTPDGSAMTAVLINCPRLIACTMRVARISLATGRVATVLYSVRTGSRSHGVYYRLFSADPSGRYLMLVAGVAHRIGPVNGWIDHGHLVPLAPVDGDVTYEAW